MPATRPTRWSRSAGPLSLSLSLLLHVLLLGLAALATFGVLPVRDDDAGTIAVSLAKPRPRASEPEPPRALASETWVAESVVDEGIEAELLETETPALPVPTAPEAPRARDQAPLVALDLTPPDLASFDLGGGGSSSSGDAGAPDRGQGAVASVGVGGRAGGAPGGGGEGVAGTGKGAGSEARAGSSTPVKSVREPAPVDKPTPLYPKLSRRAGEEGSVVCRLHLSDQGSVTQVDVVESSGFTRLDEAAREMLALWRFEPKLVDGRAVATTWMHKVTFQLDG